MVSLTFVNEVSHKPDRLFIRPVCDGSHEMLCHKSFFFAGK